MMGSVAVLKYRLRNPVIDPVSFGENVWHGRFPASPRLLFRASTETSRAYVGFPTYPVCPGAYEDPRQRGSREPSSTGEGESKGPSV
jgi:hypothetical protein